MRPYYNEGGITIYHGDSLEILPQLPRRSIKAVVTDPPYIIGSLSAGNMASKSGGWADMMNSSLWFQSWYGMVDRLLTLDGVFWTCLNWRSLPVVMRAALDAGLPITSVAVWDKMWIGPGGSQGLRPSYEMVALLCRPDFSIPDRGIPDVIPIPCGGGYKPSGHPAEKPVALMARLLEISAMSPNAVVLDPFLGSGTTARAAKDAGLACIGIEAEERYCEMAVRRLGQGVLDLGAA